MAFIVGDHVAYKTAPTVMFVVLEVFNNTDQYRIGRYDGTTNGYYEYIAYEVELQTYV